MSIHHAAAPLGRGLRSLLIPGVAAALALSACGSSDSAGSSVGSDDNAADESTTEGIQVSGAWARTSPMSATAGAAYMVLTASSDDVLVGASVDPGIAAEVQIHETTMVDPAELEDDDSMSDDSMGDDSMGDDSMGDDSMGDDSMSDGDHSADMGVMQMREVGSIELPAGEAVSLEPGGYHIMFLEVPTPLEAGQTFDITLDFENADDMVVTVEVRDDAPAS